jgi:hypothetical protein
MFTSFIIYSEIVLIVANMANVNLLTVDEFISRSTKVLKESGIKHIRISSFEKSVCFTPFLINFRIFLDLIMISIATYAVSRIEDKEFYLIPIIFGLGFLIVMTLMDFNSINRIMFDFSSKKFKIQRRIIINRLFIKYVLRKRQIFSLYEIKSFTLRSNESSEVSLLRYYVDLRLKDDSRFVILSFAKEDQATSIAKLLNSALN